MERTFLKLFASKSKSNPEIFFADTQVSEQCSLNTLIENATITWSFDSRRKKKGIKLDYCNKFLLMKHQFIKVAV